MQSLSMKDVSSCVLSFAARISSLATHRALNKITHTTLLPLHNAAAQTIEMLVAGESLTCEQSEAALSVRRFCCVVC